MTLACPLTFAPGLNFLEDWLQSLIEPADQSGDMAKGKDSNHWSTALVSVLSHFHVSRFSERKVQVWFEAMGFSKAFLLQGCASLVLSW